MWAPVLQPLTLAGLLLFLAAAAAAQSPPSEREAELLLRIRKLEERLAALEARLGAQPERAEPDKAATAPVPAAKPEKAGPLADVKVGVNLDGYYSFNTNRPFHRVNLLRAYDVTSNNFSLNQTGFVIERAPDPAAGRRFGLRLDLMYGQATETLQGNPQNELRPQVYRPLFQAYGSYVVPAGNGVKVDFGKWASALGYEGNYTKDQINYSRSYWFIFLPFYHFGFRTTYDVTPAVSLTHWLVNGAQQSEDFNGFKSQAAVVTLRPARNLTWSLNYYAGREQRDVQPRLNPGIPERPTQPGLPLTPIRPVPRGRLHVLNTYADWNATDNLLLALEADLVVSRMFADSPPARAEGGAAYARYRFTPHFALGGRVAYLRDLNGLFSGVRQNLLDTTLTASFRFGDGFLLRAEYRRDGSNVPFFPGRHPGILHDSQNTATLGMIWWFGNKEGTW